MTLKLPSSTAPDAEFHVIELLVPAELAGLRLDVALARLLPQHSRTRVKAWMEAGEVWIDGLGCKPRDVARAGARVRVRMSAPPVQPQVLAEAMPLVLLYEDRDVLVIDKPAGLVVHPGAGNPLHTLQNALLGFDAVLAGLPRAGLIHRLDKDTSGLLVVARTLEAHTSLTRQLAERTVSRHYLAVCVGVMTGGGTVDQPIGRHRTDRRRMTVRQDGRAAVTHYWLLERFAAHTALRVTLQTGRTHQIRLHLSHLHYPLVGDPVYGGRCAVPKGATERLRHTLRSFKRQALHAAELSFDHPRTGARVEVHSPLPADYADLLAALRDDARARGRP